MTTATPPLDASPADADMVLADFGTNRGDPAWYVVNDYVMGGRSEGGFTIEEGELRFAGRTNTDGGGFSSIRTRPVEFDLSMYDGIRLRVKGDGRRYTWRLTTAARWEGREVAYWADFDTQDGSSSTVDIPFSRFVPRHRGTRLEGPDLDPAQISGLGLMIYDRRDGPFELRLTARPKPSAPRARESAQAGWNHGSPRSASSITTSTAVSLMRRMSAPAWPTRSRSRSSLVLIAPSRTLPAPREDRARPPREPDPPPRTTDP